MAVLLQFNEQTSLTVQQLSDATGKHFINSNWFKKSHIWFFFYRTGIAQENLLQVLQILLKAKLLTCSDDESSLTASSVIELYLAYKK